MYGNGEVMTVQNKRGDNVGVKIDGEASGVLAFGGSDAEGRRRYKERLRREKKEARIRQDVERANQVGTAGAKLKVVMAHKDEVRVCRVCGKLYTTFLRREEARGRCVGEAPKKYYCSNVCAVEGQLRRDGKAGGWEGDGGRHKMLDKEMERMVEAEEEKLRLERAASIKREREAREREYVAGGGSAEEFEAKELKEAARRLKEKYGKRMAELRKHRSHRIVRYRDDEGNVRSREEIRELAKGSAEYEAGLAEYEAKVAAEEEEMKRKVRERDRRLRKKWREEDMKAFEAERLKMLGIEKENEAVEEAERKRMEELEAEMLAEANGGLEGESSDVESSDVEAGVPLLDVKWVIRDTRSGKWVRMPDIVDGKPTEERAWLVEKESEASVFARLDSANRVALAIDNQVFDVVYCTWRPQVVRMSEEGKAEWSAKNEKSA